MLKEIHSDALEWQDGVPKAPTFGDIYYSLEGGLAETEHVFLGGIGAPEVWQKQKHFTIAETGFGTGLNFLATYKKWMETGNKGRLTFISAEKFPLSPDALEKAHAAFPELEYFSSQLRAAWPPAAAGFHPRYFENGKIQLLLLFGDAAETYRQLSASVDAWFLDGFSPAKNPEMWSDVLFDQIARLSRPGTRFATFTAAGFVKRGLAAQGFAVKKTRGFARKRERLVGEMGAAGPMQTNQIAPTPEWARLTKAEEGSTLIIGAGIAGRSLAAALARRGHPSVVIAADVPTASHVPAAILAPGFQVGTHPTTPFVTSAFAHACWLPDYIKAWARETGVEIQTLDTQERLRLHSVGDALGWGPEWLKKSAVGLEFPKTGSIDPAVALEAIYPSHKVTQARVLNVQKIPDGWAVQTTEGTHEITRLIFATGAQTAHLMPESLHLGLTARSGQIETLSSIPTTGRLWPQGSLSGAGYVTAPIPTSNESASQTLGSTITPFAGSVEHSPPPSPDDTAAILAKIYQSFDLSVPVQALGEPWTGIRAATIDYMPYVGPIPDWHAAAKQFADLAKDRKISGLGPMPYQHGLFILSGFGSKGFQQAPYAAEYLAAHLCGDPLPMSVSAARYLHPARHFIKKIIQSQPITPLV